MVTRKSGLQGSEAGRGIVPYRTDPAGSAGLRADDIAGRLPPLLPGKELRCDRARDVSAAPVQVQGGGRPLGSGYERGGDKGAHGGACSARAHHQHTETAQRAAAAAVPGRDGGGAAAHPHVRWVHDLLPERRVLQRVHRPDTAVKKRAAHARARALQPLLPDAMVLQQARVRGAVVRQGVDGAAGRPGRGQLPGFVRGLYGGEQGVLREAPPDLAAEPGTRAWDP